MQKKIVDTILLKLNTEVESARHQFLENKKRIGIGFCYIENLLPEDVALEIYNSFDQANPSWREMRSFREKKLTSKQYDKFNKILKEITFAIQDSKVINCVEKITGIKNQLPDPLLYAGGLSMMRSGDFLDPHIDNSHENSQQLYRRLNLLYYVTPGWSIENGGNLELWDTEVKNKQTILSAFNRLVIMETHALSWHSVSQVIDNVTNRCCVSNYYFSKESPIGSDYFHVTSFMARPEQPLKRLLCIVDNNLRSFARKIKKSGFGKVDIYKQKV